MKVAIVCDSMSAYGGAERVIEQMLEVFPQADIYATLDILKPEERTFLGGRPVKTSVLQSLPKVRRYYRRLLGIWPFAVEQFDVSDYDLILSSHHSVAYGVLTRPGQVHVSYVHSPMRYAWDLQHEYLRNAKLATGPLGLVARSILHRNRIWDFVAAQRPDAIAANSHFVAERLRRTHRRESTVIYPPVAIDQFHPAAQREDYYVTVGRLVSYKRAELLARTFAAMPHRRMKIIGTGPDLKQIEALAAPNVEVLGYLPDAEMKAIVAGARAFIFAGVEDFGIAAIEAQACGTPVIAYRAGGLCETVLDVSHPRPTGLMFDRQDGAAIREALDAFETMLPRFTVENCVANARRFSADRFRHEYAQFVEASIEQARVRLVAGGGTLRPAVPVRRPSSVLETAK